MEEKIILVTNDDGISSQGINTLVEVVKHFGKVIVVAPDRPRSGHGMAITIGSGISFKKLESKDNVEYYSCTGTPVDCVKIAVQTIIKRRPDFIISGINHGSNVSCNLFYSGTMGAVIEGCLNGITSVGFSHISHSLDLDFSWVKKEVHKIFTKIFNNSLPKYTCLNVNFPDIKEDELRGTFVCTQTQGKWEEEFIKENDEYILKGEYVNLEPQSKITDMWAIENNYIAIVPVKPELTANRELLELGERFDEEFSNLKREII